MIRQEPSLPAREHDKRLAFETCHKRTNRFAPLTVRNANRTTCRHRVPRRDRRGASTELLSVAVVAGHGDDYEETVKGLTGLLRVQVTDSHIQ